MKNEMRNEITYLFVFVLLSCCFLLRCLEESFFIINKSSFEPLMCLKPVLAEFGEKVPETDARNRGSAPSCKLRHFLHTISI